MPGVQRGKNGGPVDIVSFVWKTLYSDIYFKIALIDGMMSHIA